jgi:hypothetical protein
MTSIGFYFLCLIAWDVIVTFGYLFVKIDNDGNWQEGRHYFARSSILGLLLSFVCWPIRFVWKCCMKEVQWRIVIRNVNKDLTGEALGRTLEKLSTFR